MEIKRNEATVNRPGGDRVLDASYVFMDIPQFIEQLKNEKAWEKNDRNGITVFKSDAVTIVITALKAGAELGENNADEFISIQLLKGTAQLATPDGEVTLGEQQEAAFHPNVVHSLKAASDCILMIRSFNVKH